MDGQDGGRVGTEGHETSIPYGELTRGHGTIDTQGKQNIDAQV